MRLYHRTPAAKQIIKGGFRDAKGTYGTGRVHRGVWLSDRPLDVNEGAIEGEAGADLFLIEIPARVIRDYEWVEDGKPYREWLVPAKIVNRYGPPRLLSEDEEARIVMRVLSRRR